MQISNSNEAQQTLYEAVGGEEFFHTLVHRFYDQVK